MNIHGLAGRPASEAMLVNVAELVDAYYTVHPNVDNRLKLVAFGTSGHRGSSLKGSFNEDHILAIAQAICEHRKQGKKSGPLFLGRDTHALSEPSLATTLEVLAANGTEVMIPEGHAYTPTPVISHAILGYNRGRKSGLADGIVITPSHNPPEDGGFKYNPPHGGPADIEITTWIEHRANELLKKGNREVARIPYEKALRAETTHAYDYVQPYVDDLQNIMDMEAIRVAGIRIGIDPLGGASAAFWEPIAARYGLNIEVVNKTIDPTFRFMTLDRDGKIRMDCSSPYAMARLIDLKDRYDIAFGTDPDSDRHGIVTPRTGLMNPNHYLAVAVSYLFGNRPRWGAGAVVGKTLVSSSLIDRVARHRGREVWEVPVGFKWFVDKLLDGSCGFAGEESAGATFLRKDGTSWTTDKDGIIMGLLAAEITARTGRDPGEYYKSLTETFGTPLYERIDIPATPRQQAVLKAFSPTDVPGETLAGEPIIAKLTAAPGNGSPIGGLKVVTENGWFAARPSGTEDMYKVYTESFRDKAHLEQIQEEAKTMIGAAFCRAGL